MTSRTTEKIEDAEFETFVSTFNIALQNTGEGPYANQSSIWDDFLSNRSNYPTASEFRNFLRPDTPFASGIGIGRAQSQSEYEQMHLDWVDRYRDCVKPEDLAKWPEPKVGNPTILNADGYTASVLYMKNFALAQVLENTLHHVRPDASNLKVLEIGAGYGGVAEVLIRKGIAASYTVVDLPANLFLSLHFLRLAFPDMEAQVINAAQPRSHSSADLRFALPNDIELLNEDFDLVINTMSLGEMPKLTAQAYVSWVSRHLSPDGLFISHNTDKARNVNDVIQKHSEYGFEKFSLAYVRAQPASAGILHRQHLVLALGLPDSKFPTVSIDLLDRLSAITNMGLHEELNNILSDGLFEQPKSEYLIFLAHLECFCAFNSLEEKRALIASNTGNRDCDLILEIMRASIRIAEPSPESAVHLKRYLENGASPVAICLAAVSLAAQDEDTANLINSALERAPSRFIRQAAALKRDSAMYRFMELLLISRNPAD